MIVRDDMRFGIEKFSDALIEEMMPLWKRHYEETANEMYGPMDPQIEVYRQLDVNGMLRMFTARHKGQLCGYQIFVVAEHLHSRDLIQATQDILYLAKEYRKGLLGYRFLQWCQNQLRENGVQVVHQVISARHNFGKLFERMGCRLEDLTYSKRLLEVA